MSVERSGACSLQGFAASSFSLAQHPYRTRFQLSKNPVVFVTYRALLRTSRQRGRAGDL